jgi:3-phenylpropionate/trans-cinnamate dioxygenase ferredoxin subunit
MAWHPAAEASAVGDNQVLGVTVAGVPVALYRLEGEVYATHDVCTHEEALLSEGYVDGGCVECPLHQARFNIKTGAAESAPATEPVKTYPTKVEGGRVFVDLPG